MNNLIKQINLAVIVLLCSNVSFADTYEYLFIKDKFPIATPTYGSIYWPFETVKGNIPTRNLVLETSGYIKPMPDAKTIAEDDPAVFTRWVTPGNTDYMILVITPTDEVKSILDEGEAAGAIKKIRRIDETPPIEYSEWPTNLNRKWEDEWKVRSST